MLAALYMRRQMLRALLEYLKVQIRGARLELLEQVRGLREMRESSTIRAGARAFENSEYHQS